jgi:ABC-type multidrug transport system fused ATPase/permease subunit
LLAAVCEALALVSVIPLAALIASDDHLWNPSILGHELTFSVWKLAAMILLILVARTGLSFVRAHSLGTLIADFETDHRDELLGLFLNADWPLQAREEAGRLQSALTQHLTVAVSGVNAYLGAIISVLSLGTMLATTLLINPLIALGIVVAGFAMFALLRPVTRWERAYARDLNEAQLDYAHAVAQAVGMAREIRSFDVIDPALDRVGTHTRRVRRNRLVQQQSIDFLPVLYHVAALTLLVCGLVTLDALGFRQIASLAAVVLVIIRAVSYGQNFQLYYHYATDATPALEILRSRNLELEQNQVSDAGEDLERIDSVGFEHVGFHYTPGTPVLEDFCFELPRGELIGIVGPSGAGKSTFVQLLLRLREPVEGTIRVNGVPADRYNISSWHRRVAYVPQEPVLLDGTVAENIRFYRDDVAQETIESAARLAHLHDDILEWDEGYDTPVGDRGSRLSGGQRQRICIARALVGSPDVIVMDEPTSSLDVHSELVIQQTLSELSDAHLVLVVAHRMSTLNTCDRIMVFTDGHLGALAPRDELEQTHEYYADVLRLSRIG